MMATNITMHPLNSTSIVNTNYTTMLHESTTKAAFFTQGQKIIHNSFNKFDFGILLRAGIILVTATFLVLMFIGVKTYLLRRRRRQTRKYKLLSSATRIEEPLFNGNDDEEEEKEDDTLFVRK